MQIFRDRITMLVDNAAKQPQNQLVQVRETANIEIQAHKLR